jgi:membrane protease YdiL (CAAX protease family)
LLKPYLAAFLAAAGKFTIQKERNMQTYLKSRPVGIQLLLFIGLAFGIFSIFSFAAVTILPSVTGIDLQTFQNIDKWDGKTGNMLLFIRIMLIIQFLGLFLIPTLLFGYFSDPEPMKYLGFKKPYHFSYLVLGIIAILAAIPLVEYIGLINKKMILDNETTQWMKELEESANRQIKFMLKDRTVSEYLLNLVFIAVFAAVGEELFFRGVLQRLFIKLTKNPWIGIILSALLFSGFHLQFYGFFPRLLLGVILGVLYWYSGSLWTAIIAHFVYDAFLVSLIYSNPRLMEDDSATLVAPAMLAVMALMSAAICILLVWRMVKTSPAKYSEIYQNDNPPDELSF